MERDFNNGFFPPYMDSMDINELTMQYEQACSYYRYLCMQMDYKIKCKEYEKLCNENFSNERHNNSRKVE